MWCRLYVDVEVFLLAAVTSSAVHALSSSRHPLQIFFFQAEDGIRDDLVTGVQTCALPIFALPANASGVLMGSGAVVARWKRLLAKQSSSGSKYEGKRFGVVSWEEIVAAIEKIGRASCRERV